MAMRPGRLLIAALLGITLAVLLALQSASSVLMPRFPAMAARLMPVNGLALEQAASQRFIGAIKEEADIVPSAQAALPLARKALEHDPLAPKAIAIMAFAEGDPQRKRALLAAGDGLNRRDLMLQGLILETQVADRDYAATLETLDKILRVHPEQTQVFFPILTDALGDPAAARELGALLDNSSPWHEQFLRVAASDKAALPNLAKLRMERDTVDPEIDQRLIAGLVKGGNVAEAYRVYRKASGTPDSASNGAANGRLGWELRFAPFDWRMANDAGFRAQPALGDTALDVFVRSGKGGVLAERLVPLPQGPAVIVLSHSLEPKAQVKDVRLQIGCPGDDTPVLDQPLRIQTMRIPVPQLGQRCDFLRLAIYGRSWSGRSSIRGEITRLSLEKR